MANQNLESALQLTSGARFVRGDLHVHSFIASHDVRDATATPEMIVSTALAEGLSILAIADHNEISGVEAAIKAAIGKDLLVVPAVELSTNAGHLLCYLPTLEALQKFHAGLSLMDRGAETSRCTDGIVSCLDRLHALGGFALLAHVDGPKGFDTEVSGGGPHKADVICHAALLGIELKNAASTISYSASDPDAVRKGLGAERARRLGSRNVDLARVLNSDAHTINRLGRNASGDRKVTRYKLQSLTFDALRLALVDADARVRLEDELPKTVPTIDAIAVTGGFLKEQQVRFSPNLNCIIGGRGTGKSTLFTALRALSPHPSESSLVGSDAWPDRVDVAFTDQVGEQHFLALSRGDVRAINQIDPLEGLDTLPIECYGQGETQDISQRSQTNPSVLLAYIDRFTDARDELAEEEAARGAVIAASAKVAEARAKVAQIDQTKQDLAIKRTQRKKLEDGDAKRIIEISRQLEIERQTRNDIIRYAQRIASSLDYGTVKTSLASLKSAADPAKLVVGTAEFEAITKTAVEFEQSLGASEQALKAKSEALSFAITGQIKEWSQKESVLLSEIQTKKAALEAQGIPVNLDFITKLTAAEVQLRATLTELEGWLPILQERLEAEDGAIKERWAARKRVYEKRRKFAGSCTARLRETLGDLNVSLKFAESGLSPDAMVIVRDAMGWRTNQVPRAEIIVQDLTVPALVACIRAKNSQPLRDLRTDDTPEGVAIFTPRDADAIIQRLSEPDVLASLEAAKVYDRPKLMVTRRIVSDDGQETYRQREFAHLSLGQQQSVLLALMLASDSPYPLLIDQPEDDLDSEFIFSQLVPALRRAKERRQIIVITHNANIAVLGDAEQIIVLRATNERGVITSRGSIDDAPTKDAACDILEGARDAFVRRGKMYGISK